MDKLGERLQARARELGLADAEVARRLGLAQARYSHYVNGVREPDFGTFIRICHVLAITPNQALAFGEDDGAEAKARLYALIRDFDAEKLQLALGLLSVVASHGERPTSGGSVATETSNTKTPPCSSDGAESQPQTRPPPRR